MKRYQVYLNPLSISILDELKNISNISRSRFVGAAVDRFVQNLSRVISAIKTGRNKKTNLDNLVGIMHLKTKKKTNFALRDDDIYLRD